MSPLLRKILAAGTVLVLGSAVALGLLLGKPAPEPEAAPLPRAPLVDVVTVASQRMTIAVSTQGTVVPAREISLVSQVAGRVEAVAPEFAEGGFVRADDPLVMVEQIDYELALARAESQLAAAQQRLAEEKGRSLQARREWRDLGSSEANDLFLRKPQLAAAAADLRASEAEVASAAMNLQRTRIAVPFNGRISDKQVDAGQYISPGAVLARVYATDEVEVRLPLTDADVSLLDLPLTYADTRDANSSIAAPVTLTARFANRDWQWQGEIVRTEANIDVDSRLVYAVARVRNPFDAEAGSSRPPLAPGLFVRAEIQGRWLDDVAVLPRSALRSDNTVMVVDGEEHLQLESVTVVKSDARRVWLQGLPPRSRVVVGDAGYAVAGMPVTVNSTTQSTAGLR